MLFRLLAVSLLLIAPLWAQENPNLIRLRAPFEGLVLNTNQLDMPEKAFFVLSNAALTSSGEIYKRGGSATLYTTEMDSNHVSATNNSAVNQLYRFYKTDGTRRLLANYIGGRTTGAQFSHWYQDSTNGWKQNYSGAPDSISQVMYKDGTVSGIDAASRIDPNWQTRVYSGSGTTFHLNVSNNSVLRFAATPDTVSPVPVLVINDTVLFRNTTAGVSLSTTEKNHEIWYRSAHSGTSPYFTEALTYLDTVYFSRGFFDPVKWEGTKTFRVNILDYGVCNKIGTNAFRDSLFDSTKNWPTNQWTGMWLLRRTLIRNPGAGEADANDSAVVKTNWIAIEGNDARRLKLDYNLNIAAQNDSAKGTDRYREYAIVSMPIDEVYLTTTLTDGNEITPDLANTGEDSYQEIIKNPVSCLIIDGGLGAGQFNQVTSINPNVPGATDATRISFLDEPFLTAVAASVKCQLIRSRFPIVKFIRLFKDRMLWISDTTFQNSYWWSEPGKPGFVKPNSFSVVNPVDGEKIQAVWLDENSVKFAKETRIYAAIPRTIEEAGTDPTKWQIVLIADKVGCEAPKSVVQRAGTTWFYDWPQGFYQYSDQTGFQLISEAIRPMTDSVTAGSRDKVFGVYYPSKRGDFILWGFPINGSTKPNRLIAYSPAAKAWSTFDLTNTDSVGIASALVQEGPGDVGEMILGLADSGYVLRYNPDANQDTLDGQGTPARVNTFALTAEGKRFEIPDRQIRFWGITPTMNNGGVADVNFDFYKNQSTTSLQTLTINSSGWITRKKSLSDAVVGNQLAYRITTVSGQSFRLGGLDIHIMPAGRRLAE